MTARRFLVWSLAALAVLPACADPGGPATTASTQTSASPQAPAAAEVLDFSAPRLGGGMVRGADYAGADLAIWFWAPW